MCMYFTLTAHLLLGKPHFKCSVALCGQWLLATTLDSAALDLHIWISQSLEMTQRINLCWCLLWVWYCSQMCQINALNESIHMILTSPYLKQHCYPHYTHEESKGFELAVTDLKSQWQIQDSDLESVTLERMFLATPPGQSPPRKASPLGIGAAGPGLREERQAKWFPVEGCGLWTLMPSFKKLL